ncbi:hypothetical protein VTL71DRAFT_7500 [Oculimacula yallundae]|uniref:Tryptophan synthase n=1 Tax=Oculimacula yallundae TaxID=86028 RepID=A0ABR4BUA0_9HELO
MLEKVGKLPDAVVACVGGGRNASGMFSPFSQDLSVQLLGVEAAGDGLDTTQHAATLSKTMKKDQNVVICISGRGNKDVQSIAEKLPALGPVIGWDLRFEPPK